MSPSAHSSVVQRVNTPSAVADRGAPATVNGRAGVGSTRGGATPELCTRSSSWSKPHCPERTSRSAPRCVPRRPCAGWARGSEDEQAHVVPVRLLHLDEGVGAGTQTGDQNTAVGLVDGPGGCVDGRDRARVQGEFDRNAIDGGQYQDRTSAPSCTVHTGWAWPSRAADRRCPDAARPAEVRAGRRRDRGAGQRQGGSVGTRP